MGRAPCCDKANVKKGPWSPEEDAILKSFIDQNGTVANWIALPKKIGLRRCGKSCRLRWLNYLRPNIKHGAFSEEEENIICNLYVNIGSRWSIIAAQLPGRTDNHIKNYWNTRLKKKLLGRNQRRKQEIKTESDENLVLPLGWAAEHYYSWARPRPIPVTNIASIQFQHSESNLNINQIQRSYTNTINSHYSSSCHTSFTQYPSTINMMSNDFVNDDRCRASNMFDGFGNLSNDLSESDASMQGIFGIESMDNMVNGSTNWGDTSSLVYSPLVSDDHDELAYQQRIMPQHYVTSQHTLRIQTQ